MDHNLTSLTKGWIQFLKNNQIVSTESDPKTGLLRYNRTPNVTELMRYLQLKTDFDEDTIRGTIRKVLSKKAGEQSTEPTLNLPAPGPDKNVSTWQHSEMRPGKEPPDNHKNTLEPPEKSKKYSNDDVEDIKYKDVDKSEKKELAAPKKPRYKYRGPGKMDRLSEAFYDRQGAEISEDDIKSIFRELLASSEGQAKEEPPKENTPSEEEIRAERQDVFRRLKELVRDVMTPAQRKALWRALNETNLSEAIINKADIVEIFKDAAYLRSKPTGLGKIFKRYRKDQVSFEDLQKAWAEGIESGGVDGHSNDTRDIKRILQSFGFEGPEIDKVFSQVFRADNDEEEYDDEEDNEPVGSRTVQKIADIAKEKGVDKALKSFLEKEFADELELQTKKATYEDVREIFTAIIKEERKGRMHLIKEEERLTLGRSKK